MGRFAGATVAALALCLAGGASAQLPPLPGVGQVLPGLPQVGGGDAPSRLELPDPRRLADLRLERLTRLVRTGRGTVARDERGEPIVAGRILASAASAEALAAAERSGFRILKRDTLEGLGFEVAVLAPPANLDLRAALAQLRAADPQGGYEYDHLYFGSGAAPHDLNAGARGRSGPFRMGLIDTGVADGPAMAGARVERAAFGQGPYRAADHGSFVAALAAAEGGPATLYSADVYGSGPAGGSAEAVVRALNWMAQVRAPVVNISLVGPDNRVLRAGVEALMRKGGILVAAVGNDGPAAPPAYPASYPGVIAVTGVDRRERPLLEAGRAQHVDFAAPGADVAIDGRRPLRGTSFAAPIVAAKLAVLANANSADPVRVLGERAKDLGARGPDPVFGRGAVGLERFSP